MGQYCQCHNHPCSNGLHGWEASGESSPRLSSHTSPTSGQCMWMPTSLSQPVSPRCFNTSYGASKDTWVSATGTPSCQLHAQYLDNYWRPPHMPLCSASSISKPQSPQPSQGSSDVGSLWCEVQEFSTHQLTSPGAASNFACHWSPPPC